MALDEKVVNGLRVLAAIVNGASFARAAEALDMSPSGVSRAVARLEQRLGIRLFERTTRKVALSDEGRRFYERVAPLMDGLEEATAHAAEGAVAVRGRLRVNVDPYFSRLVLGPRLGVFLNAYPGLELELVNRDQLGDLVADGFDLALRFGFPRSSGMVARKLLESRIITVAAPSYLEKHGRPLSPRELEQGGHVCILFRDAQTGRPFSWEFHKGRRKLELQPAGQLTVNDAGSLHSVCLAGYGIAQMMALGAEQMLADGRLVDLFPDWPDERFPLYALYPSRRHLPAKTAAFLAFVASLNSDPAGNPA